MSVFQYKTQILDLRWCVLIDCNSQIFHPLPIIMGQFPRNLQLTICYSPLQRATKAAEINDMFDF